MPTRLHDEEFSPEILRMLKKRGVLGQANWIHFVPLDYNVDTEAHALIERFQIERRENPLLELTPAEAWLAAEAMPIVHHIRASLNVEDAILSAALQRYFCYAQHPVVVDRRPGEQKLCTSVEAYFPLVKKLLTNLYDLRKSLREILGIPANAYTLREAMSKRRPSSRRETLILSGLNERRANQYIARQLDAHSMKPRSNKYKSYLEMVRINPQAFYALKSDVKKKYREVPNSSEQSTT